MFEVIIIGGGPAGSALGSYLSLAGIKNIIIEKENFPRPHVGESFVTASTRIFDELGFLPEMEKAGFPKKYGAAWHPPTGTGVVDIEFREFPQEGIHQDHTYHVDRSKFDLMLLKHAEKLGSKVVQGVQVSRIIFEGDAAKGVECRAGGETFSLKAPIIVDASGRDTLLGRQLNMVKKDPIFNQFAIHAWFKNVERGSERQREFIHIYFLPVERGWVWQIPITNEITSIGVVVEKEVFKKSNKDFSAFFEEHIHSNPNLSKAMKSAERINDFKREGNYSYSVESFIGNGYLLIGDAARFVDPIFSSGVSVALYSAKFASQDIVESIRAGDYSMKMFETYNKKLRKGVEIWYEFITLYYKLVHLFTYFIKNKTHRLEVLRLLQGEVFEREEVPVLKKMREFIAAVEKSDTHIFHKNLSSIDLEHLKSLDQD